MIKQMPTQEEVASLLVDISQTGLASGLEFRLFQPGLPIAKEFYSELPIKIEVVGKYEELSLFVSGLAALPRIVTVHDVVIKPVEKGKVKMPKVRWLWMQRSRRITSSKVLKQKLPQIKERREGSDG